MKRQQVGIVIYEDVEVLDFCGPFEVFTATRLNEKRTGGAVSIQCFAGCRNQVASGCDRRNEGRARSTISIAARNLDILVVPGGWGTRQQMNNERLIKWIAERSRYVETLTSVCTGALLLGKAGLLDGKRATTHWRSLESMQELFPKVTVEKRQHFVEEGALFFFRGHLRRNRHVAESSGPVLRRSHREGNGKTHGIPVPRNQSAPNHSRTNPAFERTATRPDARFVILLTHAARSQSCEL